MSGALNGNRRWTLAALSGVGGLAVYSGLADRSATAPELSSRRAEAGVSRRAPLEPRLPPRQPSARAPTRTPEGSSRGHELSMPFAVAARCCEQDLDASEHPHPISERHRRIFEENNRLGAMNGAMDRGDFDALRRMNAEYREAHPEDDHDLQEGYELIADCLEARTEQAIEAARRFWQRHRASTLRRHVRRHCLEEHAEHDAVGKHAPE